GELLKVKERIVAHVRKLICQGDTVLKEAMVNMFFYQRQQSESVPLGYHNLESTCRPLEPGEPYLLYVLRRHRQEKPPQTFSFQEYVSQGKGLEKSKRKTSNPLSATLQDLHSTPDDTVPRRYSDGISFSRKLRKVPSSGTVSSEDPDDRDPGTPLDSDFLDSSMEGHQAKTRVPSRAALTHRLRKLRSKMVKCRQCENYIMVNGLECEECGLALHRKCLEVCLLECERGRGVVFGVGLARLCRDQPDGVPFVVQRCTAEIESHSLAVQGVYRVCGSKHRIQRLCQAFETQGEQVELSNLPPHDITSVLKHFFKEIPEPLLTFDLYGDFINVGKAILHSKEAPVDTAGVTEDIVNSLRSLLEKLPLHCYSTLQHITAHLHRVSQHFEVNRMSSGNLGIVFGPTLLRPLESLDMSMEAVVESSYQALLVEFLITQYDRVFGPRTLRAGTPPPPAPTAPLPETPPRPACDPAAPDSLGVAVGGVTGALEKDPAGGAGTQFSLYNFTRQPVKYQRHPGPRPRRPQPSAGHPSGGGGPDTQAPGTAEVVNNTDRDPGCRSSSPDPQRPNTLDLDVAPSEGTCQGAFSLAPKGRALDPLSPRAVVEHMLALDAEWTGVSGSTTVTAATRPLTQDSGIGSEAGLPTGGAPCGRQGAVRSPGHAAGSQLPSRLCGEQPVVSGPAHKILSGLKPRRRRSGKDEQLFV
ncbi:hypothetical protein CRUP_015488, partial [Coryphaenoides rupestris]